MKFLPLLVLATTITLLPTLGRAEEAPSSRSLPVVADAPEVVRLKRQTSLQLGADGTLYQVRYDLAKGREYWSSPYIQHPNHGIRFVYLLDKKGQRRSQTLYVESASGRLQLASTYRWSDRQLQASHEF
jgi:hypothetical protein